MSASVQIEGYHAHVYFDALSLAQGKTLCEAAAQRFALRMGRVHERLVGPHPCWSCQLAFDAELFAEVVPWLMLHRGGLDVLVHPLTDDELRDHRDGAMWLGRSHDLDLSVLSVTSA